MKHFYGYFVANLLKLFYNKEPQELRIFVFGKKRIFPGLIDEGKIRDCILPHLSKGKRGFKPKIDLATVIMRILKRMKTGCRWRELLVAGYFPSGKEQWQHIYYYFNNME